MDTVIKKISEIEASAVSVMEHANAQKKAFAHEMEMRTNEFDRQLEEETDAALHKIRSDLEADLNSKLAQQKSDAALLLARMEQNYKDHHLDYARQVFQALIKE